MRVRWSDDAIHDRANIWEYIERYNPLAAIRLDEQFSQAANQLGNFPHLGRSAKRGATREFLAHKHYWLVYEIREDAVWIVGVIHTSRQWPPEPDDDA